MAEVNIVAILKIKPEHINDARPLLDHLIQHTRAEEGCIKYQVNTVKDKEGVFVFT